MTKLHASALVALLMAVAIPSAVAQTPLKDMVALLGHRKKAPVSDIFKGAFKHGTVFRGRTLTEWMNRFRDADPDFYKSAHEAFLAMGSNAIPFLLACDKLLDWEDERLPSIRNLIIGMGEKSIAPLARLLSSDYAFKAWWTLNGVLGRHQHSLFYLRSIGEKPPKEWMNKIREGEKRAVRTLMPCVGSGDAFTRYAGLNLLRGIIGSGFKEDQKLVTKAARKILDTDPQGKVRVAACELLAWSGSLGVPGGLSKKEAETMVNDIALSLPIRLAARMRRVSLKSEKPKTKSAKPPARGK